MSERIAVIADDLIWASRLMDAVARAGAAAVRLGSGADLAIALEAESLVDPTPWGEPDVPRLVGAIVDLFGHRYDGIVAVEHIHAARLPVIAVAQHDDQPTRKRALAAGASRVFSYQKFFADGPGLIAGWLHAVTPDTQHQEAR